MSHLDIYLIYPLKNPCFLEPLEFLLQSYGPIISDCEGGDLVSCDQKCGIPEVELMHPKGASENVGKGFFSHGFFGFFSGLEEVWMCLVGDVFNGLYHGMIHHHEFHHHLGEYLWNFFPSIEKANPSISVRETSLNHLVSVVTSFQWDAGRNEPGSNSWFLSQKVLLTSTASPLPFSSPELPPLQTGFEHGLCQSQQHCRENCSIALEPLITAMFRHSFKSCRNGNGIMQTEMRTHSNQSRVKTLKPKKLRKSLVTILQKTSAHTKKWLRHKQKSQKTTQKWILLWPPQFCWWALCFVFVFPSSNRLKCLLIVFIPLRCCCKMGGPWNFPVRLEPIIFACSTLFA